MLEKSQADARRRHGGLPHQPIPTSRPRPSCTISSTTRCCTSMSAHVGEDRGHAAGAAPRTAMRSRSFRDDFTTRHAAFRLHGKPAHSGGAGAAAQVRAEIRHHDDILLPRPAHDQACAQFRHAALAGQAVHRAVRSRRPIATEFFSIPSDRVVELGAQADDLRKSAACHAKLQNASERPRASRARGAGFASVAQ